MQLILDLQISGNEMEETMDALFERLMSSVCENVKDLPGVRVFIVPSPRDAHHLPVYPSPPFETKQTLPSNVHLVSDPCIFDVDGVTFGVTAADSEY